MKKLLLALIIILFISCQSKEEYKFIERQKQLNYLDNEFSKSYDKTDSIEKLFRKAVRNADWKSLENYSKAYSAEVDNMNRILDKKSKLK